MSRVLSGLHRVPLGQVFSEPQHLQVIRVTLTSSAVQFRCEDDGKVCQGSVRFPANYFTAYNFSGKPSTFTVHLMALADALRVFAALPGVPVMFTETQDHLLLETTEKDGDARIAMYAHLVILGTIHIVDLIDHWQPPATEFVTSNTALREAVEDLEWPHGHVQIKVQAKPFQVRGIPCTTSSILLQRASVQGYRKAFPWLLPWATCEGNR
jgi:hypothetical protein